jgi:enoyl-CoA hydratase/carnithine racemase
MDYTCIDYTVEGAIATVTLDRPESLNALTLTMARELVQVMDVIDADDDVRAVVFTGRGRAYCAGADLSAGTGIFERESTTDFDMAGDADWAGRCRGGSSTAPSRSSPPSTARPLASG